MTEQLQPMASEALCTALREWFTSPLGAEILAAEQGVLDTWLPEIFGYHLLQVGYDANLPLAEASPVSRRFTLAPVMQLGMTPRSMVAQPSELPVQAQEMDLVILHHALDFDDQPHQVLREAARVLRPGGHLLIIGFNPNSLWGVCRRWCNRQQVPWRAHGLSHGRLQDWIKLLELTEVKSSSVFHRPPLESPAWRERLGFLEGWGRRAPTLNGSVLMLLVRKDRACVTPLKPQWRTRRLITFPVAEPTARGNLFEER